MAKFEMYFIVYNLVEFYFINDDGDFLTPKCYNFLNTFYIEVAMYTL